MPVQDTTSPPMPGTTPGILALLLGLCECGLSIQSGSALRTAWRFPLAGTMLVLGLTLGYAGYRTLRGSTDAAVTATLVAGLNVLLTAVWFVVALSKGNLSSLTLVVLLLSLATVIYSGLFVTAQRRALSLQKRRERT